MTAHVKPLDPTQPLPTNMFSSDKGTSKTDALLRVCRNCQQIFHGTAKDIKAHAAGCDGQIKS